MPGGLTQTGTRDYHAFMRSQEPNGFLETVEDQLKTWLREKRIDLDVSHDNAYSDGTCSLSIAHREHGRGRQLRAELREDTPSNGPWRTTLVAGSDGWLDLAVRSGRGQFTATPRLAKYLMQALPLGDASVTFVDRAQEWGTHQLSQLREVLVDPDRYGLVFVAGTEKSDLYPAFARRVNTWTREVYGLAQVVVLSPEATTQASEVLGRHSVSPWTVRTFFPGVDLNDGFDALRHRYLTARSLAGWSDPRISFLLGEIARFHANQRPLPEDVARAERHFARLERQSVVEAIQPADAADLQTRPSVLESPLESPLDTEEPTWVADEASTYLAQVDLVRRVFGLATLDESSLRLIAERAAHPVDPEAIARAARLIEAQQDQIEDLHDRLSVAARNLDDAQLDHAELLGQVDRLGAESRWLRARLAEAGDFGSAHAVAPEDVDNDLPESFADLLDRLSVGDVIFTGRHAPVDTVEIADTLGVALRMCWDVCRALGKYVEARRAGLAKGGVEMFLRNPPEALLVAPGKHSPTESEMTMKQYGSERVFPVPAAVHPSGQAVMTAHFRLAQLGMTSPRLYYLDDTGGSGKIYVGYIGPHLRNTLTN